MFCGSFFLLIMEAKSTQDFKKVEMITPGDDNKKHFVWVLVEEAIKDGVKSTTRYRKSCSKKSPRSEAKAFQRQRSGQKGGRATRKWKSLQAKKAEAAAVAA